MMSGCRASLQIREWDGLGFCSRLKFSLSRRNHHFTLNTRRFLSSSPCHANRSKKVSFFPRLLVNCLHSKTPADLPNSLSQREEDQELSYEVLASVQGGIVALGKFDALHVGHRELAIQASNAGAPFLLSFVGMAEVLGWEPRAPIVAKCDRERVLSSWASYCGNVAPKEFLVEFSSVRHLSPQQFVEKLSRELGVRGVVAGQNYRFGYRASGTASDLVRLCTEYGVEAYIIDSVMDKTQILGNSHPEGAKERGQVSSTRVRYALANGDMSYVNKLLGRPHRVILSVGNKEGIFITKNRVSVPRSCLLNLPPKDGLYRNCFVIIGDGGRLQCALSIEPEKIHLDLDEIGLLSRFLDETQILGIEFGEQMSFGS